MIKPCKGINQFDYNYITYRIKHSYLKLTPLFGSRAMYTEPLLCFSALNGTHEYFLLQLYLSRITTHTHAYPHSHIHTHTHTHTHSLFEPAAEVA